MDEPFQDAQIVHLQADESFITPDGGDEFAWLVLAGTVRQFDILEDGSEYSLNIYKPGAVLSLSWLFGESPNKFFFQALSDVTVARIEAATYRQYIESEPVAALQIIRRFSKGLDGFFSRLSTNSKNDAPSRIMNELRIESTRFKPGENLAMTTQELSNRTGLARETVSRTVHKLEEQGLIVRSAEGIQLI